MIPIYMISLERDTSRRLEMQRRFPKYYPNISIINAVDAKNEINTKVLSHYNSSCTHNIKTPLTLSEKCCSISHLITLKEFVISGVKWCIILEDDILGSDRDIQKTMDMISKIDQSGVLILGGQNGMRNRKYLSGIRTNLSNLWFIPTIARGFIYRTCCYAIDQPTAKAIIAKQDICLHRADDWQWLTQNQEKLFYTNILKHPTDLSLSNIEISRKKNSDNIIDFFSRNISKLKITARRLLLKIEKVQ